jgi:hypothetical protein
MKYSSYCNYSCSRIKIITGSFGHVSVPLLF